MVKNFIHWKNHKYNKLFIKNQFFTKELQIIKILFDITKNV